MISVFLVDDHGVVRDGLRAMLETADDIEVVGDAANGREAVSRVKTLCPDVVVMDIAMPELNGIEATEQIHGACPSVRLVVLSMHCTTEHVFRALRAGAQGYVLKEAAGDDVVEAVYAVCRGERYLSQKASDKLVEAYMRQRETAGAGGLLADLSQREREVLQLVAEGKTRGEMADILGLSPKTIDTYRSRLRRKLGIQDLPGLIRFAVLNGIASLE
jgi:DNA-binding NarL/FixJ family response regulator